MKKSLSIALVVVLVMFFWAICYPLISLSLPFASLMHTAYLRSALAGCLLLGLAVGLRRTFPRTLRQWMHIVSIGLTATSIGFWGMFNAGAVLSPGLATVLTNTQPLIACVLGWFVLKEHMGRVAIAGLCSGFLGIVFISAESAIDNKANAVQGILFVVIASLGIAISNVLLKRIANAIDIFYTMGFQLLIGSVPLAILNVYQADVHSLEWTLDYALLITTLTIPGTALPFLLWFWLLQRQALYKLNVFNFLTPVFGLFIGFAYFSESLSFVQWLGVVLILFGIVMVSVNNNTRKMGAEG